ncbi:uncharacterized protein PITG_16111 [Phytophthora infestans T30-4]|uniref:Uncharacterized protein n=1 Tax=Phytophthora infestans (strain T30-4) TaxID=403677 RepID=D0NSX1_PHYIT|nr:uncharacterized protein PITG_16111 [Phytophthora infestans T30-4]EEY64683.1 conserved hypothetical protein [Phytophthora infestans T30-4]|eukprot:XP_002897883.1 conserved hypothetical protein [Phytophthora infestans T30-4]
MSSCEELSSSSHPSLACPSSADLQDDMSSSTLALLTASDLPSSSQNDASNVATTALHLERYASELLLWLQRSDVTVPADDALFFFETRHPELLDDLPLLFAWLSLFLAQHEDASGDMTAVAGQFALKSALTLLYCKHDRPRAAFQDERGLLEWVLSHRDVPLTRQDIVDHVMEQYPVFAASKSAAALKVWTSRFLKKHIPPHDESDAAANASRRSGSGKYMLFSNEFKLHAVNMLDEGKSVTQVAEELGLKNPNCLSYWKSIRDKLVTAERKRFRLAGGGRRSSCSFEDELLTWVSERHHQGLGTDVKAVLEYMKEYHSSFTEGKKEPTLRKWILRFFKRCWRAPSTSIDSQVAEKSYIFV